MNLCIGTVQFGLHYGIASKEHPNKKSSIEILEYAAIAGINTIDTASAYGNAEQIVGEFLSKTNRRNFRIITKIRPDALNGIAEDGYYAALRQCLEGSLQNLGTDYVDGCLFHNAAYVNNEAAMAALNRLTQEKLALKTGVSIYLPEEFKQAVTYATTGLVQIPYNLLDQRLNPLLAQNPACEIHARSAFLQGLLMMPENAVPNHLAGARNYIQKIQSFCSAHEITRTALLLSYVKAQKSIQKIVFGVDSLAQLKQIIHDYLTPIDPADLQAFSLNFQNVDEYILMPNLWKGDNQ